jgi:hypothetical protein
MIILDEFFGEHSKNARLTQSWVRHFDDEVTSNDHRNDNPVDNLPVEFLFAWAQINPSVRFTKLAAIITPFMRDATTADYKLTPLAFQILHIAPDRLAILEQFSQHFVPMSWSGSRSAVIESRRAIPRSFLTDIDPKIVAWARDQDSELEQQAERERTHERLDDERFEY